MNALLIQFLGRLQFGRNQASRQVTVIPLLEKGNGAADWQVLDEAIAAKTLTVSEISEQGSVPQLKVINQGDHPVLLVNGEELVGARQNRVLNTSILFKERFETTIPVSCVEQGRWRQTSVYFSASSTVMHHSGRQRTTVSVTESLKHSATYASDQGAVWKSVNELQVASGVKSSTSSMHDVYEAKRAELEKILDAFRLYEGQVGLIVLINGKVAGAEVIGSAKVYAKLHRKLLRSYVMESLFAETKGAVPADKQARLKARRFWNRLTLLKEQQFPSIGYGRDCRFTGRTVSGTALVHDRHVVHAGFFSTS